MRRSNDVVKGTRKLRTLPIPAGGQRVVGEFADDGYGICGGDQHGPAIWIPSLNKWIMAFIAGVTIPFAQAIDSGGTYGVAICATNSNYAMAVAATGVWNTSNLRTVNADGTSGATWTRRVAVTASIYANEQRKMSLPSRCAIDPINGLVQAAGLPGSQGLQVTQDGVNFAQNAAVPTTTGTYLNNGSMGVVFDRFSTQTGGKTQGLYAFSSGNGLYRMTGGVTGAATNILTDPVLTDFRVQPTNGKLWVCGTNPGGEAGASTVRSCPSGSTTFTASNISAFKLACHPTLDRIYAVSPGGGPVYTSAAGANFVAAGSFSRLAPDSPWQATTNEIYMKAGFLAPGPDRLWLGEGIGMWSTDFPTNDGAATVWTARSRGIEDMVGTHIERHPITGVIDVSIHDRVGFTYTPDKLSWWPSRHVSQYGSGSIQHSNSSSRARDDDKYVVRAVMFVPSVSTDGGLTWGPLGTALNSAGDAPSPALPGRYADNGDTPFCGNLVVSNKGNCVWISGNGKPMYFKNGAWGVCDFGTAANAALDYVADNQHPFVFGGAYTTHHVVVMADRATAGRFLLYWGPESNLNNATEITHRNNTVGVWESLDGGVTWTRVYTSDIFTGDAGKYKVHVKQVPGFPSHMFIAALGGDPGVRLAFSDDYGRHWYTVPGVTGCGGVGFQRNLSNRAYPRITVIASNIAGLAECLDFDPANPTVAKTWSQINGESAPNGLWGELTHVGDDMFGPFGSTPFTNGPTGGYLQEYSYTMRLA